MYFFLFCFFLNYPHVAVIRQGIQFLVFIRFTYLMYCKFLTFEKRILVKDLWMYNLGSDNLGSDRQLLLPKLYIHGSVSVANGILCRSCFNKIFQSTLLSYFW